MFTKLETLYSAILSRLLVSLDHDLPTCQTGAVDSLVAGIGFNSRTQLVSFHIPSLLVFALINCKILPFQCLYCDLPGMLSLFLYPIGQGAFSAFLSNYHPNFLKNRSLRDKLVPVQGPSL